jgi:hypothetical protein
MDRLPEEVKQKMMKCLEDSNRFNQEQLSRLKELIDEMTQEDFLRLCAKLLKNIREAIPNG